MIVSPSPPPHSLFDSPPPSLILVGTVHGDPEGYGRAWRLLEYFQPKLVSVEISPFSVRYRRRHGPCWQRLFSRALAALPPGARGHLAIQRLAAQVALPFELSAAMDWGQAHGVPWRALDLGGPARRHLPRYGEELLSRANLQALLDTADGSLAEWVAEEYRRARLSRQRAPWVFIPREAEARWREEFLARRLRRLAGRGLRVVHLGGWEHLAPWQAAPGLEAALAQLKPLTLLLEDADSFPMTVLEDMVSCR